MKSLGSRSIGTGTLFAGLLAVGAASAQGTWNLGTNSTAPGSCNAGGSPSTATCKAGISTFSGIDATISAYSNTATTGSSFVQINLTNNDPNGFGAMSGPETGSPDHAFDNMTNAANREGGTQEFMLIGFGNNNKVNLSSLQVGWSAGQSDLSIYRWDGNNTVNVGGSSLASNWSLVSSMDVWNNGTSCDNLNVSGEALGSQCKGFTASAGALGGGGTDKYSSWWLISTYMGGASTHGLDGTKNDSFKVLSFTANLCAGTLTGGSTTNNGSTCGGTPTQQNGVPEPGSLALVGLALTGVYSARRRSVRPAQPPLRLAAA